MFFFGLAAGLRGLRAVQVAVDDLGLAHVAGHGPEVVRAILLGQSGAGLVKVTMTCKNDVRRVQIDPSLLADDKDMLEDLVAAAFNDAVRKTEATTQEKMSGMTAGMPMPPGFKLPF